MQFADRREAGRLLAARLQPLADEHPIVIALPRGGVPVAFEVARALGAPLDILAVRKIGAPRNPEFGVGAIAEDGSAVLDVETAGRAGMTRELLDATVDRELRELRRRVRRYRDDRAPLDLRGRTVVVVDDGVATGLTDLAAVRGVRARGAARVILAVPVGARESLDMLGEEADEVVCHTVPAELLGVGRWYRDFTPVPDDVVVALLMGTDEQPATDLRARTLRLDVDGTVLSGDLALPPRARGVVLFAHGSGSSRLSPRNRAVAATLNDAGFATLLLDLLTDREARSRELVFDIPLLARRLQLVTTRIADEDATRGLPTGYFGASTGAGAALHAAAAMGDAVRAVVSRGGRPDLAGDRLPYVTAPTLLLVGSRDPQVLELNRRAAAMLRCAHELTVVRGAGHLFEEPGTLEAVAEAATRWFGRHLTAPAPRLAAVEG